MSIAPDETCVTRPIRPITDGTLTEDERWRLLSDPRCIDGVHTEWLSQRERDHLAFLRWRMDVGMVTE